MSFQVALITFDYSKVNEMRARFSFMPNVTSSFTSKYRFELKNPLNPVAPMVECEIGSMTGETEEEDIKF